MVSNKGSIQKKKSQIMEKVQKGGGSAPKIKKSKIQNLDFLIRGGGSEFSFFSQIQMHTLDTSVEEKIS